MKIIAATKNKGKVKEISDIFGKLGFEVVSQDDAGIHADVEEDGKNFEENAMKKAKAIFDICKGAVIADDSGLCVDALGGAPGIYSARFAGEGASDDEKIAKLLDALENEEDRRAKFVSVIVVILPDGKTFTARGEVMGKITREKHGCGGFGYDPIFLSDELGKTFGESSADEKNRISHRGRALLQMYDILENEIGDVKKLRNARKE